MKLTLISPVFNRHFGLTTQKIFAFPPLNLPIVASLTPPKVPKRVATQHDAFEAKTRAELA
jgi:hypothetical protein